MSQYIFDGDRLGLRYDPAEMTLSVSSPERVWSWTGEGTVETAAGVMPMKGKLISSGRRDTGVAVEFRADYSGFGDYGFTVSTMGAILATWSVMLIMPVTAAVIMPKATLKDM